MHSYNNVNKREHGVYESITSEYKYRFGIIDFLTDYNKIKRMETKVNNVIHWGRYQEISCQEPTVYKDRFINFIKEKL